MGAGPVGGMGMAVVLLAGGCGWLAGSSAVCVDDPGLCLCLSQHVRVCLVGPEVQH